MDTIWIIALERPSLVAVLTTLIQKHTTALAGDVAHAQARYTFRYFFCLIVLKTKENMLNISYGRHLIEGHYNE